ncbi:hypothetical protein DNTS_030053 [Danionella cerebrum]|uniref:Uncharacterized protein n=1 Tax=Danionella cerebrum TaxID=2873325 RepID=A0A553NJ28_9TELE|nr:hypothetical protein DNTS_030053 [Danionella translucida]
MRVCVCCPRACPPCPLPSLCPLGISSVVDGCGCCKVCAAQLNEPCSANKPCDHHKGLECNYGNDVSSLHGICRGGVPPHTPIRDTRAAPKLQKQTLTSIIQSSSNINIVEPLVRRALQQTNHKRHLSEANTKLDGRSCEYNGRIYQNGENFRAGCKHQCTCIDGAVGCVPLCPAEIPLASPSCPNPSLVKIPGQCCLSVDCHRQSPILPPLYQNPPLPPPFLFPDVHTFKKPRVKPDPYKHKNSMSNEVEETEKRWEKPLSRKHLPVLKPPGGRGACLHQTSSWTQCSRSCGLGLSSRVSNENKQCKLMKETRLCNIRPCSSLALPKKKGKKCSRTQKSPEPLRLRYAGCRSTRLYQPNFCGVCLDGRCCSPRRTRTIPVPFSCPDGERFERAVMFIQSCKCNDDCGHLNEAAMPPQQWLYGDMHKFID